MSMCSRHRHEFASPNRWGRRFGRFGSREEWLSRLEEYQRDLEQEVADVADMIRRLKEETPPQTASV
jgi:hypothetical protein